jgi:sporulation-control protein spo0M
MGLFDKLKLSVGIGGAKVEVKLNPGPVPMGGFAKGQVIIHGGKVEQKLNGVLVTLKRSKVVRVEVEGKLQDQTQTENLHEDNLAPYEQTISAGSDMYYEFAMQVPNEGGEESRISYEIHASADIPGAIDPSASVKIPLTKAAEMTAAQIPQMLGVADQLRNQGNKEAELEGVLAQVLALDANNTRALRMMAEVQDYRSPAEAAQRWKALVALIPEDIEAWGRLAQNAERRGTTVIERLA